MTIGGELLINENTNALIDSGSVFIYLPDYAYLKLIPVLESQAFVCTNPITGDYLDFCHSSTSCGEYMHVLPSIVFLINGQRAGLGPDIYLESDYQGYNCVTLFSGVAKSDLLIFGSAFMRGFIITFDYENLAVYLTPNGLSPL